MFISNHIQVAASVYGTQQINASRMAQAKAAGQKADGFYMSSQTQSFGNILRQIQNQSDDVRMDRVNALERQIAAGTYNVSSSDIAASMLAMRY